MKVLKKKGTQRNTGGIASILLIWVIKNGPEINP
jgi:hypothetical protein